MKSFVASVRLDIKEVCTCIRGFTALQVGPETTNELIRMCVQVCAQHFVEAGVEEPQTLSEALLELESRGFRFRNERARKAIIASELMKVQPQGVMTLKKRAEEAMKVMEELSKKE